MADDVSERLATLHLKQQREGLTDAELQTLARFVQQYETVMLVRAQAAALLQERGVRVVATTAALNLNRPSLVKARQLWITVGWHPPDD